MFRFFSFIQKKYGDSDAGFENFSFFDSEQEVLKTSEETRNKWEHKLCGIFCLAMIAHNFGKIASWVAILKVALEKKAFLTDVGWDHKKLAQSLQLWGIFGRTFQLTSPELLISFLEQKKPCILSISPFYMFPDKSTQRGGHLVLLYRVLVENGKISKFCFHDPGSSFSKPQKAVWISRDQFLRHTSLRGIFFKLLIP